MEAGGSWGDNFKIGAEKRGRNRTNYKPKQSVITLNARRLQKTQNATYRSANTPLYQKATQKQMIIRNK